MSVTCKDKLSILTSKMCINVILIRKIKTNTQYTYISWLLKIMYAPLICKQSYKSNTYHSGIRSVHQGFWSPDGVIMNMHIHKLYLIFDILDKYMYNHYSLNIKSPLPVGLFMFSWNSNFLEMLKFEFYKYWWHNTNTWPLDEKLNEACLLTSLL